jgi:hypothetical protein
MGPAARRSGGAAMRAAAVGVAVALVALVLSPPLASALRPLRERVASVGSAASVGLWGDEVRMVPPHFHFRLPLGIGFRRIHSLGLSNPIEGYEDDPSLLLIWSPQSSLLGLH